MRNKRIFAILSSIVLVGLIGGLAVFSQATKAVHATGTSVTFGALTYIGDSAIVSGQGTTATPSSSDTVRPETDRSPQVPNKNAAPHPLPTQPPSANGFAVTTQNGSTVKSFDGLTHADQRLAGTGIYTNTQFSLEPPDQAACVGNGYVVDGVNNALAVYSTNSGTRVSGPTAFSQFFNRSPEVIRTTRVRGDFLSDPRCHFDTESRRWFVTELEFDTDPATGVFNAALGNRARNLIAVSKTDDPTGGWALFSFDVTDDGKNGTPAHANCACFGDQPMIGFDHYGFYITTNEFSQINGAFNGNQTYAISKWKLISAANKSGSLPTVVAMNNNDALLPYGGQAYSLLPAIAPPANDDGEDTDNQTRLHGVEYFMSALDFTGTDNRMAVWALTNTASLSTDKPNVTMQLTVINSEAYAGPGNVTQKPASSSAQTPYKNLAAPTAPLEQLQSNDDRTNGNTVFSQGKLLTTLNTAIQNGTTTTVGTAWFEAKPSFKDGVLKARMVNQGYVSVNNNSVLYGTVGVNAQGQGIISFTLAGPDYYPSTGFVRINSDQGTYGKVHLTGIGAGPDDGFTGYPDATSQGAARWGDYGAVAIDGNGNAWSIAEYIPNAPRTLFANWGTRITNVTVSSDDNNNGDN